jgi:glycerate 2-kinase
MHILARPDKFRGTATALTIAASIIRAAEHAGHTATTQPLADGGEGALDAFGGANRWATVTGPLGHPVMAGWRLDDTVAIIEAAQACGILLTEKNNQPVAATTKGVGELLAAAISAGADKVLIGVGGTATSDGGRGAADYL